MTSGSSPDVTEGEKSHSKKAPEKIGQSATYE